MAIVPENDYANTNPADANYTQGSAKNVTAPNDGTGTPLEKAWVNDNWGFQQSLLDEAGVSPSGSPDTVPTSQYKESVRIIANMRTLSINFTADADKTLTAVENRSRKLIITDTGVVLTTAKNVIIDDVERMIIVTNNTLQILTIKTALGSGVQVQPGISITLYCDGTDVIKFETGELSTNNFLHIQEQYAATVNPPIAVAGPQTRILNTVLTNTISGASLAATIITLPAGTYYAEGQAPAYGSSRATRCWLWNNTDSAEVTQGRNARVATTTEGFSVDAKTSGIFTIASPKDFKLNQWIQVAGSTLGFNVSDARNEIYAEIKIWKVG